MPKDIHISASLLKDYLECPLKAHWRSTYQVEIVETPYMVVGSLVHNIIEDFWNDKEQALFMAKEACTMKGIQEPFLTKVKDCVDNFFEHFAPLLSAEDKIEYRFKLPFGKAFIVGKIDRITSTGIIIDWKTGVSHTKSQVDKIRRHGVQILSYFIEEDYLGIKMKKNPNDMTPEEREEEEEREKRKDVSPLRKGFHKMYGKTAKFIDVNSVVELAKTINGLFIKGKS